ncbi:hypothetical protein AVEN_181814-1, partial [Araneus ventricosus]
CGSTTLGSILVRRFCVQKTCFRPTTSCNTYRRTFSSLSARRRTAVPQFVADHFVASGRRISATTVRRRLHNTGLYARRPVVHVPLNGRQRRTRLCWAQENTFPGPDSNGLLYSSQTSPDSHWRAIQGVC